MKSETAPHTQRQPVGNGALGFIFTVILLDLIGLTILQPVQAYIVRQYNSDALTVSLLTVIYAAAQFVCAPILGRLSDRYGRRPVLLISVLGSAFGYYLFGVGGALWVLFLSRLIDGITGGNISTASAYIADITPPHQRAKRFAPIGVAFGLGFILGPALGGVLSQISLAAPAYAAGALSLLSAIVGFFVLPESLPREQRTSGAFGWREINPLGAVVAMVRRPVLGALLLVLCLFYFAFNGYPGVLSVFAIERFNVQPFEIAIVFVVGGVANAIVQGGRFVLKVSPQSAELIEESLKTTGAMVAGRRMFDVAGAWAGNPPSPPCFILTHSPRQEWVKQGSPFTFVTDGVASAIRQAKQAAGDKNVAVATASITQQCIKAGLLDEIHIDLVPILLGEGIRLFDHLGTEPIELASTRVIEAPGETHLGFRVVKQP